MELIFTVDAHFHQATMEFIFVANPVPSAGKPSSYKSWVLWPNHGTYAAI